MSTEEMSEAAIRLWEAVNSQLLYTTQPEGLRSYLTSSEIALRHLLHDLLGVHSCAMQMEPKPTRIYIPDKVLTAARESLIAKTAEQMRQFVRGEAGYEDIREMDPENRKWFFARVEEASP